MGIALRAEPTTRVGPIAVVDGGIAMKHPACGRGYTAFTREELTPLPYELTCEHCGGLAPLVWPDMREAISRLLEGVQHKPTVTE